MPSLHPFTFIMFFKSCFSTFLMLIYVVFINLAHYVLQEETVPAARTSVVPRPMSVVFGLGTRLRVRMRTKLENGVLHNGQ